MSGYRDTKRTIAYQRRPTQRAADLGYAPRFQAFFVALSFFRFDGESTYELINLLLAKVDR